MLYKGSNKIGQVYKGNTKIGQIYKGSTLIWSSDPYEPDYVVYERTTAGTETVNILGDGYYEVYCIAGGAGYGHYRYSSPGGFFSSFGRTKSVYTSGGSGSGFIGIIHLQAKQYQIIVGSGGAQSYSKYTNAGGNSSIDDIVISYGGTSVNLSPSSNGTSRGGAIPTINTTIISQTLNVKGNDGIGHREIGHIYNGGKPVYDNYGKGGGYSGNFDSTAGYVKIVYKGQ